MRQIVGAYGKAWFSNAQGIIFTKNLLLRKIFFREEAVLAVPERESTRVAGERVLENPSVSLRSPAPLQEAPSMRQMLCAFIGFPQKDEIFLWDKKSVVLLAQENLLFSPSLARMRGGGVGEGGTLFHAEHDPLSALRATFPRAECARDSGRACGAHRPLLREASRYKKGEKV